MTVLDSFSLSGKVALVAGGGGKYGRGIVRGLAEAGAETWIGQHVERIEDRAAKLRADGYNVQVVALDQSDEESISRARDTILEKSGRIDVLINNAVIRPLKDGWQSPASAFDESMRVNATGLFMVTRAIGDAMAEQGSGSIVNVGSIQGLVGPDAAIYEGCGFHGFVPDYFFHKGGMVNFTRFAASHYGPKGVRCNCICPGGLYTENLPERFVNQYSARTFLGRMATIEDLMGIIVFLASDASSYITGGIIPVDGGYTAK